MGFKVLHAEVRAGLVVVGPWAAHEDFVAVHRLLQVGAELFQHVVEAPGDAGVFAGLGDLFGLHHFFEQGVEHAFPVLLAQGGRQQVDLFNAGLLECGLGKEALGVKLNAFAVDVQEPQRGLGVVLGERRHLRCVGAVATDAVLACAAQAAVAEAVERGVLALVVVLLLVQLLDHQLHLVVGQGRRDVLLVVFDQGIVPVDGDHLLQVDADVEERIVACAFGHALRAQRLQARWAVLDGMVRGLGFFWKLQIRVLHPLLVQLVELFKGCGIAVVLDGVTHGLIPTEIRQVQEVARVATVNQDFGLLGENLAPSFAQQGRAGLEVALHFRGRYGGLGEQEHVCATGLAAAHHHGQAEGADLLDEASMVQWVLVDVDAAPDARVVGPNGDDAQTRLDTL